MHWNGLNSDLKHFLNIYSGRGVICQKYNSQINENFENWPKVSNQICRWCENAKYRCHQQIYYKLRTREAIQYQLITNHYSQISFH